MLKALNFEWNFLIPNVLARGTGKKMGSNLKLNIRKSLYSWLLSHSKQFLCGFCVVSRLQPAGASETRAAGDGSLSLSPQNRLWLLAVQALYVEIRDQSL